MPIKNPFANLLNRKFTQTKASKTAPLMVQIGGREPRMTPRQFDKLADEGYRKNIIVYRSIRLVTQNAASIPFAVYRKAGNAKIRLEDHPLATLLRQPNPMQGGSEMFEQLYAYFLIAGNTYLENICASDDVPRELWVLRPDRVRIIPASNGMVDAYRYQVSDKVVDFKTDPLTGKAPVLHLKSFHPLDDYYGMSPLEAAAFSIDQHNDAAKWNASLLQSSGRPSGAIVFRPSNPDISDTLTSEQREALKDELEQYYSGASNAGKPLVLEGGLDWKEMSLTPQDMDWLAGKDVSAREIALAFHVPPQLIGVSGSQTFANFEQARLALYDDAVLPLLCHVRDELNNWLCPKFGDDITIDFDADKIDALAPRREKIWERVSSADFMTLNEKRAAVGLSPLKGGDTVADASSKQKKR